MTLSFDLHPGHSHEAEVKGLLARVREDVMALWQRVADLNAAHPPPEEGRERIVFYAGQNYLASELTKG